MNSASCDIILIMIIRQILARRLLPSTVTPFGLVRNYFAENKPYSPKSKQEAWLMQEQEKMKKAPTQTTELDRVAYSGYSRIGVLSFTSFLLLTGYLYYSTKQESDKNMDVLNDQISGLIQFKDRTSELGGDWTLIDSNGQPISSRNLQGYYYLIFFSYTNSPEFCAGALYYLSTCYRIIRNLPEGAYLKLKIVFVSIDPQRDTPEVMRKFLKNFGKQVIGVTGSSASDPELLQTLRRFRIKWKREQLPANSMRRGYQFDHSTHMYLMDPQNMFLSKVDDRMSEHETARELLDRVIENEYRKDKAAEKLRQK